MCLGLTCNALMLSKVATPVYTLTSKGVSCSIPYQCLALSKLIFTNLVGMKWYLPVLIFISLIMWNALFICLLPFMFHLVPLFAFSESSCVNTI